MECKVSSGPRLRGGAKFLLHLPPLAAKRIPFLDVRIMLGQRPRENMAAVALGAEEVIVVRPGVETGGDRRLDRVAERPFGVLGPAVDAVAVQTRLSAGQGTR